MSSNYGTSSDTRKVRVGITPESQSEQHKWIELGPGATLAMSSEDDEEKLLRDEYKASQKNAGPVAKKKKNENPIVDKRFTKQKLRYNELKDPLQEKIDEQTRMQGERFEHFEAMLKQEKESVDKRFAEVWSELNRIRRSVKLLRRYY